MLTEKDDVTSGNRIVAPYADESVQGVAGVGLLDWLGQAYAAVAVEFVPAGIVKVTVPPPARLALTDCDEVIVTEHVVGPEHAPPQPRKDAEVSVNWTTVPLTYVPEQMLPAVTMPFASLQLIWLWLSITVPDPVPSSVTLRV